MTLYFQTNIKTLKASLRIWLKEKLKKNTINTSIFDMKMRSFDVDENTIYEKNGKWLRLIDPFGNVIGFTYDLPWNETQIYYYHRGRKYNFYEVYPSKVIHPRNIFDMDKIMNMLQGFKNTYELLMVKKRIENL